MRHLKVILLLFLFSSCEDVVDVDLPETDAKLIVDAVLRVNVESPNENRIKISKATSFFDPIEPSGVEVLEYRGAAGTIYYAPDPDIPGDWIPGSDNVPIPSQLILPTIDDVESDNYLYFYYQDELYLALTKYKRVVAFDEVIQGDATLFDEDDIEIKMTLTDPADEDNYYIIGFGNGEFIAIEDQFFDGQQYTFSYFSSQNLQAGDEMNITLWGVGKDFYNYYEKLLEQSEMGENPLFTTPVSTIRGNILKVESIDNIDIFNNIGRPQEFVLGYFAIIQERIYDLTIN